ncbi:heterokaryon incompatibility protein-domain-containing protein [Pyrenochaeta sp. MPI-SDFR-AT-0127]|nr:heterokaryon incompatibility protein-domain-containing protein [Pyrenochaeta sp. MPI-SDFR-AT-0127]
MLFGWSLPYTLRQQHRFGDTPTEDEEVSEFAIQFLKQFTPSCSMPEIPPKLCDLCKSVPIGWLLESPRHGYTLFRNAQELRESEQRASDKTCDLCGLILKSRGSLGNEGVKRINIGIAPQFLIIEAATDGKVDHSFLRLCADLDSEAASMNIEVGLPHVLEADTGRDFSLLGEWLRDCNDNHSDHRYDFAKEDIRLPTRLLNVGDSENIKLHLYETKEAEGTERKYIALSHCWGGATPLRTEKGTYAAHRIAIKFENLPELFQDAVVVTRKLGVQFLWIDSLCIIQDDEEDWKYEARRMEEVFALAYCTIAATTAKNSNEHFLPRLGKRFVKLVENNAATPFSVYACEVGEGFNHDVENGLLNKRGWVLQERALSPRTIHFTATQTYWECGSVIRCDNLTQMAKPSNLLSSSRFPMTTAGPPSGGVSSVFEKIFARYSELALTHSKDRPYAIGGLERRLNEFYRTESSHGIIHCCLGKSLLWQRSGKEPLKEISDHKIETVPSWSWMRYEGKIRYGDIPKVNTSWNRGIKLIPTSSSGQGQSILAASVARVLQDCRITLLPDETCKIESAEGHAVGCIRFDNKKHVDIRRLGCVVLAQHAPSDWNKFSQDSWKRFAGVSWEEKLKPGTHFYVLVVSCATRGQPRGVVSQRLGVAVIQSGYLSFGEPPQHLWVF